MPSRSRAASTRLVVGLGLGLGLLLSCASRAEAGPWMPAPGRFYLEVRESLATTAQGFDATGHRRRLSTYSDDGSTVVPTRLYDARSRLYAEVGVATRLAVVADFTAFEIVSMSRGRSPSRSALGVGDLGAGLKLQLLDEEVVCALEAKLGFPTGPSDGPQPIGTGDLRGEVLLSVGRAWERVPIFVVVELGARLRSSGAQRSLAAGITPNPADPFTAPTDPNAAVATTDLDYASELLYAAELGYNAQASSRVRVIPRVTLEGRHGFEAPRSLPIDPVAPQSVRLLRAGASIDLGLAVGRAGGRGLRRIDIQVGGGAFVWGQGLPAAGDAWVALGLSR